MNPYLDLLNAVVDRVRAADVCSTPPAIPAFPEESEPNENRPGQGDNLEDRISIALGKSGIVLIVYIEGVDATEEDGDALEIRVQVVEETIKNRHPSGSQKTCWNVLIGLRAQLQNWAPEPEGSWMPFQFLGFVSVQKSNPLIREIRFRTLGYLTIDP